MMKRFCRVITLMALVFGITGCMQEADQAQTPGKDSGDVTSVEPSDPTAAVEHTTLKPDAAADVADDPASTKAAEPDGSADDSSKADESKETPASEETP